MNTNKEWSKPYFGISHFGVLADTRRVTIETHEGFTVLLKWFKGCGFSPDKTVFDSGNHLADAKKSGEIWVLRGE